MSRHQRDLFISHICADHELVKPLVRLLRDRGWTAWRDDFAITDNLKDTMKAAIEATILPVLCITRRYCERLKDKEGNLFYEYDLILKKKKQAVVVVILEKIESLPDELRELFYIKVDPSSELSVIILSEQLHKIRGKTKNRSKRNSITVFHDFLGELDRKKLYSSTNPVASLPGAAPSSPFKVCIMNFHGKPLTAEPDGSVSWNRSWVRIWETFEMICAGIGKVAFKSHHGRYLSAQPNGTLECNRSALQEWETFQIVPVPGGCAFTTHHGYYVCVTSDGLCESRPHIQEWETFKVQNV
jgi:hypothetical protein